MAKKNLNPADAYRKAQRKKELKKNKAGRSKTRDLALVKKDTTDLEDAIKELEESRADAGKLAELKAELEKVNKKKAEYVADHPEARRLVYRRRKQGEPEPELPSKKPRNLFDKKGLPRHPERSVYYDPVMNPYGVAPPGMPYMERPLLPGEIDSDADSEVTSEEDDDPLPEELPSGTELITSDDDIPMPEGSPPGKAPAAKPSQLQPTVVPTFPAPPAPPPPPPSSIPTIVGSVTSPPNFPLWSANLPVPLVGFQPYNFPAPPSTMVRQQNASSFQDPLSSLPHQTFQAHRAGQLFPPPPPAPSQPIPAKSTAIPSHLSLPSKPTVAAQMAAATIEGAPELRDLKKEATAFVPTAVKRKRGQTSSHTTGAPPLPDNE